MAYSSFSQAELAEALANTRTIKIPTSVNLNSGGTVQPTEAVDLYTLGQVLQQPASTVPVYFSLLPFTRTQQVTGTNVISEDFFVIPAQINGLSIRELKISLITAPLVAGSITFNILKNGASVYGTSASPSTNYNYTVTLPVATNDRFTFELVSNTVVSPCYGLYVLFVIY